jgi:hypothetical protein
MPLIYLKHPRHGEKIATLELEAEHDEKHGWERYTPGEESQPVNELRPRRRREQSDAKLL